MIGSFRSVVMNNNNLKNGKCKIKKMEIAILATDAAKKRLELTKFHELDLLIGVKKGSVSLWRTRDGIPIKYHEFFIEKCNIRREWLRTGKGEMLREDVKYDNSDHEEDVVKEKPATNDLPESFSVLRTDQIDLLKKWEKLDCKKRGALMVIMESMKGQGE